MNSKTLIVFIALMGFVAFMGANANLAERQDTTDFSDSEVTNNLSNSRRRGFMQGELYLYNTEKKYAAFKSGTSRDFLIFVPGLTEGFLALPYLTELADRLHELNWSFVQPILSSSYLGYGINSLHTDAEEIDDLVQSLISNFNARRIVFMGHSTGCQDAITYMKEGVNKNRINGVILQAPVSDRDYLASVIPDLAQQVAFAKTKIDAGEGEELMDRSADIAPITYYRYHSFGGRMTDDDMFSNDLTNQELRTRLGHVRVPTVVVASQADEYVPPPINIVTLSGRFANAMPNAYLEVVQGANHALVGKTAEIKAIVTRFLRRL